MNVETASAQRLTPLFLFSLPRSGSTLFQRVLSAHPAVCTTSEPWLLLPFFYALKDERGAIMPYDHQIAVRALHEFLEGSVGGTDAYYREVRSLALKLYARNAEPHHVYFLDKTPRYALIVEEVLRTFPEARAVFLWRNPLAIAASISRTWSGGRWDAPLHTIDLDIGLERLVGASRAFARERTMTIRFEDLVTSTRPVIDDVLSFLELSSEDFDPSAFVDVELNGSLGDQTGSRRFGRIQPDRRDVWRSYFDSGLRKRWALTYIDRHAKLLSHMGYRREDLRDDVRGAPTTPLGSVRDVLGIGRMGLRRLRRRHRRTRR